jgi:hypothetical protein
MNTNSRTQLYARAIGATTLAAALVVGGCASSTSSSSTSMRPPIVAPTPDPRVGLSSGLQDAGSAIWNLRMVSHTPAPEGFVGVTNSDLGFTGKYIIQGNYNGFQIWDASDWAAPKLVTGKICPASQSDVSVYKNLLFVSAEAPSARLDCGTTAPREAISKDRIRGLRIFDITDITNPKYITNVQTCRGSHTHTLVTDPKDPNNVYVYISGSAGVRPSDELAGCVADPNDPNTAQFRIEVIRIPVANPEQAAIVSSPRIFLDPATGRSIIGGTSHGTAPLPPYATQADTLRYNYTRAMENLTPLTPRSTAADTVALNKQIDALRAKYNQPTNASRRVGHGVGRPLTSCHDITVYPEIGRAGGACEGMGLLLDITNVTNPRRIDAVADTNFSYWHSATFNNDGTKVLFSDEWGGGGAAYCRITDPKEWGADAIFELVNGHMQFRSYYKMPAPQTAQENCVAHNGSLIPIPGRDVMVQSWYQGGISVFDFTDAAHPYEVAFFDRGPSPRGGGFWSSYWYNGHIIGSEMQRGLDIFELTPSAAISQNEIDAANLVQWSHLNPQTQPKAVWPAHISVVRSYLDQLNRENGISSSRSAEIDAALTAAMAQQMAGRMAALNTLAAQLDKDAGSARDKARVRAMAAEVRRLANAGM